MSQVTIDFITVRPDGAYCLRLLEEGPWQGDPVDALRRIQDRLYSAIEVVADGQFFERYPESKGKKIIIKLDSFRIPKESIGSFFDRFVSTVRASPEWAIACEPIIFELHHIGEEEAHESEI